MDTDNHGADTGPGDAQTCAESGREVDDTSGNLFGDAGSPGPTEPLPGELLLLDRAGRTLNGYGVHLLDWQGYLANPFVELALRGPEEASYPVEVTIRATGTSRLMLDSPSQLSEDGAVKTVGLLTGDDEARFRVAIHPDRDGGFALEEHLLTLAATDALGATSTLEVPIRVLDQDDEDGAPSLPVQIDARHDDLSVAPNWFHDDAFMAAATASIEDWFYFFDMEPFDEVAAGEEELWLTGDGFTDHELVTNNAPFSGMWVFVRTIAEGWSTGYPADSGRYHTRDGAALPGPLHRSVALIWEGDHESAYFTSMDDELWYLTDPYEVIDVYTFVMHELGHSIAYNYTWAGMRRYAEGGASSDEVIAYQGEAVALDASYHVTADYDRLSGQSGGWSHLFPVRRWMLTKLSLLIASEAGWTLNRELTPFHDLAILTAELPDAYAGCGYRYSLSSQGGIPFYNWTVASGELPPGFSLDRYSGTLQADGEVSAPPGTYAFSVQLSDDDALVEPVVQALELTVR